MKHYSQGPCPKCSSSDAYTEYADGGFCFSCSYSTRKRDSEATPIPNIPNYSNDITSRKISKRIVDFYEVKLCTKTGSHFYPYTRDGEIVAYKERKKDKQFLIHGDFKNAELFGQSCFPGGKSLVITEGELDCMSVAHSMRQKYAKVFPVVSVPSATNLRALLDQRDWIRNFEQVILMFDQDEPGQEAAEKAAKIIGVGKVKIAKLKEKDPSDMLIKHGTDSLIEAFYAAQTWSPAGIVMGEKIWEEFEDRQNTESVPYPACIDGLNSKLKGIRHGEITLFTSGTGSGKSTIIKEIILDLLNKTDDKVGLISLEESVGDTAEKFISMELSRPVMDPPPPSREELRAAFENVFGSERLILLDHQGSVGDSTLIDKIEYMAALGCRYMVLDHITIAVSEGTEGLSGNEAVDKVMSDLLKIVKRYNIWLCLVSHLRKALGGSSFEEGKFSSIDDIKGSGSIKQISFDIVTFSRNLIASNETERNTIKFRVLKSRFTGFTGDAGSAIYDPATTRLTKSGDFNVQTGSL